MSRKRKTSSSWELPLPAQKRRKTEDSVDMKARDVRSLDVYRNRFAHIFVFDHQDPEFLEQMDKHLQYLQSVGNVDLMHWEYEMVCHKLHLVPAPKYYGRRDEAMPKADEHLVQMSTDDELVACVKNLEIDYQNRMDSKIWESM